MHTAYTIKSCSTGPSERVTTPSSSRSSHLHHICCCKEHLATTKQQHSQTNRQLSQTTSSRNTTVRGSTTTVLQLPPTQRNFKIDYNGNDQLQGSRRLYNGRRKLGLAFQKQSANPLSRRRHGVLYGTPPNVLTPPAPQPTHTPSLQTPCYTSSCPPPSPTRTFP